MCCRRFRSFWFFCICFFLPKAYLRRSRSATISLTSLKVFWHYFNVSIPPKTGGLVEADLINKILGNIVKTAGEVCSFDGIGKNINKARTGCQLVGDLNHLGGCIRVTPVCVYEHGSDAIGRLHQSGRANNDREGIHGDKTTSREKEEGSRREVGEEEEGRLKISRPHLTFLCGQTGCRASLNSHSVPLRPVRRPHACIVP